MNLRQIRDAVYSRFLAIQRLHRLVDSELFERAYARGDQEKLLQLIERGDLYTLRQWVKKWGTEALEHKPIMELRQLGRKYGVENYNTLPKTHLIEGIEDAIRTTKNIASRNEAIRSDGGDRGIGVSGT